MSQIAPGTPRTPLSQSCSEEMPPVVLCGVNTSSSLKSDSLLLDSAASSLSRSSSSTTSRLPDLQSCIQAANVHRLQAHELQQQVLLGAMPAEAQEEALAEIEELNCQEAFLRAQAAEIARARRAERKLRVALESRVSLDEPEVTNAFEEHAEAYRKAERLLQEAACREGAHQAVEAEPAGEECGLFMVKVEAAAELSRHKEELHKVEMEIKAEQEYLGQHEENLRQHEEHLASIQKAEAEAQTRLASLNKEDYEQALLKRQHEEKLRHPKERRGALRFFSAFVKSAWQQVTA